MASPAQVDYIYKLVDQRDTSTLDEYQSALLNTPLAVQQLSNQGVNEILTALKALPWKPKPAQANAQAELKELEEKTLKGHYFLVAPPDNTEKFFKVEKPEPPSRWSGYTFIKVQASDYFYPIKSPEHKVAILKTIQKDPITAMNEYGIRLGVCGYCGRTLTNRDSRLRGMGPICAARILGAPTDEQLDLLRKLGLKKD